MFFTPGRGRGHRFFQVEITEFDIDEGNNIGEEMKTKLDETSSETHFQ